jgi:C-terminal processing protease CtpA/Prc
MPKIDTNALNRWRVARRITLGAIVIAGTMATAAAVTQRVTDHPCGSHRAETESFFGIGMEFGQDGDQFVVSRVLPNTPAHGKIRPGAVLLTVDGERPETSNAWANAVRGEEGTTVVLEVAYSCSGPETVVLERELIQVERHPRRR